MNDHFITVSQLTPASTRINIRVKVADVLAVVGMGKGGCGVAEVRVGDATGVVGMIGNAQTKGGRYNVCAEIYTHNISYG